MKVAMITGTSSGFGLLASIALAKEGYHVVSTMRNMHKRFHLKELAAKEKVMENIDIVKLDVTNHVEVQQVVNDTLQKFGKIDVLINNAGYAQAGFIEELQMEDLKKQFETNFFGAVAVTKSVLPSMRERREGRIINISSISGQIGMPVLGLYSASKFALEGFSESLRFELLPFGIHVVLIEPGSYKTEIWGKGMDGVQLDSTSPYYDLQQTMLRKVEKIVERAGDPYEVIETIVNAVKDPNPKFRYPVGKSVKTQITFKNLLPWKWVEKNVAKQLKIKK